MKGRNNHNSSPSHQKHSATTRSNDTSCSKTTHAVSLSVTGRYRPSSLSHALPRSTLSTFQPSRPYGSILQNRRILTGNVYDNVTDAIGNTPLIRLSHASEVTGCDIYGKAEFANPGGSIKDRAALYLLYDGETNGGLIPGKPGLIVEASAGNTAIGLTMAANSRGYRSIILIPDTQTVEKKQTLRAVGAHLIEIPAAPYANPANYVHVARRLSALLKSRLEPHGIPVYYPNQWDNVANMRSHFQTTGPEIVAQLKSIGKTVDAFNCAVGTGGTIAGVAEYLRSVNPDVHIALTDPKGALPFTYYTTGEKKMGVGSSITEGIGQSRVTGNLQNFKPDSAFEIDDADALNQLGILNYNEGLQLGLSSGINVAGAIEVGKKLGPGNTIVTVLCDNAMRYSSKMYNIPFLKMKNLPSPTWMEPNYKSDIFKGIDIDVDQIVKKAMEVPESNNM